ncbi:MAG: hypothetical protein EAX96_05455 [Candidatus Lokiarchaeota archaeon]|nr:hypothetical protein [Candidatus Lokiarchaeota archaeon]
MSYQFDIDKSLIELINTLINLFNVYNISYDKKIEEFVDIRSINFTEIQDEFLVENLVKLKNLVQEFLELEENIKDQILIDNLKTVKNIMSKIRSNHNYAYYFLKLFWSIKHIMMRENILTDKNYNKEIINYHWILNDEIIEFLELLINENSIPITSEKYKNIDVKYQKTMIENNLININKEVITPTSLARKFIDSIEISELFNYYQYDFEEIIKL